jgi:long-chain acyl-CoA synthetase
MGNLDKQDSTMQLELAQRIRDILVLDPDKGALEFKQTWYSWGQLQRGMDSIEEMLNHAQLPKGAAIAIVLRNRPAHVAAVLQILASKRCIAPVNPFQSADKIAADLEKLQAPVILADPEDWQHQEILECANKTGAVAIEITAAEELSATLVGERDIPGAGPHHELLPDTAILMLTSGTTGPAKRIKLSHSSFSQSVLSAAQHYGKDGIALKLKNGVSLLSGPLVHIGGLYFVFDSVVSGRSFCLLEKFSVPEWVRAVKAYKIKAASLPPTAIRMVMDAGTEKSDIDSLIALRSGSAPLPLDLQEEFEEKYGIAILDVYGATEFAGAITGWTLKDHQKYAKNKRGSVGRAQPGVELRIIDPDSGDAVNNGVGLLEVRSKQASESSWIRTTDLAELDADGFLYIRGRADNAIIRGGFKVLPREVEDIILQHEAVKNAAVLGIPDRRLGSIPVAAVELYDSKNDISEDELIAFVRQRTVAYKTPAHIKILDELPRTDSMKVSLHALKGMFSSATDK